MATKQKEGLRQLQKEKQLMSMYYKIQFDDIGNKKAAQHWLETGLEMGWIKVVEKEVSLRLPDTDERIRNALNSLKKEGVIKYKYDYVWIMQLINEKRIKEMPPFESVNSYKTYLENLGLDNIGQVSILSQYYSYVIGKFPDWTFTDTGDPGERLRRVNIAKRFYVVFSRGV